MGILEKGFFGEERKKIANQINNARKSERLNNEESYRIDRTGKEYFYRIGGLQKLFEYLNDLPSKKVLDIGVGEGNASRVLSQMPIASNLDIEVTALRNSPELQKNFPKEKIHITSVETLKGISDNSLAAVIGCNSIGYSDHPLLAVRRLDQVLIPGGIVKATFYNLDQEDEGEEHNGTILKDPTKFMDGFSALGYDVACRNNFSWTTKSTRLLNSIMIAIKSGNPNAPSATELLNADFEAIKLETKGDRYKHPIFDIKDY